MHAYTNVLSANTPIPIHTQSPPSTVWLHTATHDFQSYMLFQILGMAQSENNVLQWSSAINLTSFNQNSISLIILNQTKRQAFTDKLKCLQRERQFWPLNRKRFEIYNIYMTHNVHPIVTIGHNLPAKEVPKLVGISSPLGPTCMEPMGIYVIFIFFLYWVSETD